MPADRSSIDVRIRLVDAAKFTRDAKKAEQGVKDIGEASEKTGKQAESGVSRLAKWAASAYLFKRAAGFLKGAVEESVNLSKSSLQLTRLTGMDVKTASEWIVVAHQRGIEAQQLGIMFTQLGRAQQRAIAGSSAQARAFEQVGISVSDLRSLNATDLVARIADSFERMPNGLQKAALAQQFFGRQGRKLLPMLNEGGEALQGYLEMVEKYGAALEGKTPEQVMKMVKAQREMDIAMLGVKEQLADGLIPILTSLAPVIRSVLQALQPLVHNRTVVLSFITAVTVAWGLYTIATIAATLATFGVRNALLSTGIGAAIIVLAVLLVYLATHWDQVKAAMASAWAFMQRHWLLIAVLLYPVFGPFITLLFVLATHFDQVKSAAVGLWDGVRAAFHGIVDIVRWAAREISHYWGRISGPISEAAGIVRSAVGLTLAPASFAGSLAGAAAGGTVTSSGALLVGEAGPEIVTLPRAASVIPLERTHAPGTRGGVTEITVPVYVDGRELTRVVAKHDADARARK